MNTRIAGIVATTFVIFAVQLGWAAEPSSPTAAAHQQHIMIAPEDIKWGECPPSLPPGGKCAIIEGDPQASDALFTIRAKLPDHYKISPHFHPTDEHITVMSGTFKMGLGTTVDEKIMRPMVAGSFMVMPKDSPHFALTRGETIVQVHAIGPMVFTYVNPEDDPRKQ